MLRRGLYLAGSLVAGALLANVLLGDPGYVALRFAGYLVEMSAITFALALLALYALVRLVARVVNARRSMKRAQEERRRERARRSLATGLLQMAEGEWEAAESTLTRFVRDAEHPVAHYLTAARAAELQGASNRRDEWLGRALDTTTDQRGPALIMQAELYLKHKQLTAALATLEQLEAGGLQNARGLQLLARVYRQTGAWEQLHALEPRLRSTRGINKALAEETLEHIYLDRLKAAGAAADAAALRSAWKDLPGFLTQHSPIVVAYARAAMSCGEHEAAERELRRLIGQQWDEAAVTTYGDLQTAEPLQTLERAEGWLPEHAEDPALLLTCARLCVRAELYGKARSFLEASIAIRPRVESYQLLASLLEQLGEREAAARALHDGVVLAVGHKANLPKIRTRRWLERRQSDRRRT